MPFGKVAGELSAAYRGFLDGQVAPARCLAERNPRGISGNHDLQLQDRGAAFLRAKSSMGWSAGKLRLIRAAAAADRPFGYSAGMLTPSMTLIVRKR
jgi:hypothetical protein